MSKRKMIIDGFDTLEHGKFTMTAFEAPEAEFVEDYREISGYDGFIDYTDQPLGRPVFKPRKVSATFECSRWTRQKRQDIFDRLIAQVQGRVCKLTDPDHPNKHFKGRVYIKQSFNKPAYGELKLEATCEPWRFDNTPSCEFVKVQTKANNLMVNDDAKTYLADLSNDSAHTSGGDTLTSSGDVGRVSYWAIALSPNSSYYIAGQIRSGYGTWGCANRVDSDTWNKGMVSTGDDGILYVRLESYRTEWFVVSQIILLPASEVPIVENGVTDVDATIDLSQVFPDSGTTLMYSTDGVMNHIYDQTVRLKPGRQPLVLYSWIFTPKSPAPICWTRSDY